MESSDTFNCAVRVKEEPTDISNIENDREMIDEKPDLKNFHLLSFLPENSIHTLGKCDVNHESEHSDKIEIVFQCEDVKPTLNTLVIKKIDDDLQKDLQQIKYGYDYKIQKIIKVETIGEVKQEFVDDVAGQSNLNSDREFIEQVEKRISTEKSNNKHNLKTYNNTVSKKTTNACEKCGKKFSVKKSLKTHIDSVHNKGRHACDVCEKTFIQKGSLKIHIDAMHNGVKHTCNTCGIVLYDTSGISNTFWHGVV